MTKMHSSGEERIFDTGAVRDSAAKKPMIHLISPFFLQDMGEWLRFACQDRKPKPYPARNWELGMPFSETLGAGLRHLVAIMAGDESENHAAALGFCSMCISHYQHEIAAGRLPESLDDMPHYVGGVDPASPEGDESVVYVRDIIPSIDPNVKYVDVSPPFSVEEAMQEGLDALRKGKPLVTREVNYKNTTGIDAIAEAAIEMVRKHSKEVIEPPTFYVCGPMTGMKDFNFPLFDQVTELARSQGLSVISPAEFDREHGIDPSVDPDSVERARRADPNLIQTIVQRDTQVIVGLERDKGDGLILLPGWEHSTGGRAEIALALWMGLAFKRVRTTWHGQLLDIPEIEYATTEWVKLHLFYQEAEEYNG